MGFNDKHHPIIEIIGYATTREEGLELLAGWHRIRSQKFRIAPADHIHFQGEPVKVPPKVLYGRLRGIALPTPVNAKAGKNRVVPIHSLIRPMVETRMAEGAGFLCY